MNDAGTSSAGRSDELHTKIEGLEGELSDLRSQLVDLRLDQWRGRIDDLEVQARLASLDTRDRLEPMVQSLRNAWLDARERVTKGATTAADVAETLRGGIEDAIGELREAVLEARSTVED